jgi:hypothetical protein
MHAWMQMMIFFLESVTASVSASAVCVCVCVRERERESRTDNPSSVQIKWRNVQLEICLWVLGLVGIVAARS